MPNSIEDLKSVINNAGGVAKPNLYKIEMPSLGQSTREMNILCQTTALPGRGIVTHDRQTDLRINKIAYGFSIASININFKLLNDYSMKTYFDTWMNMIIDQDAQQIRYANNYKKSIKIYQLAKGGLSYSLFNLGKFVDVNVVKEDEIVYGVELIGALPTSVADITLDDASNDQLLQISASFVFENWKPIKYAETAIGSSEKRPARRPNPAPVGWYYNNDWMSPVEVTPIARATDNV